MTRWQFRAVAGVLYLVLMAGIVWGLVHARDWAADALGDSSARSEWQSFRDDVAAQSDAGASVSRRIPKSPEPPALVLLRDYFGICCVISLVLTSALFGTLAFLLGGVLTGKAPGSATESR